MSASVRAVKRTSPKCSSAERTTNKFSTSCERNKQRAESQTGLQTYKGRKPPEKQGRFHSSVQLHLWAGSTITESNSIFILFVWSAILLLEMTCCCSPDLSLHTDMSCRMWVVEKGCTSLVKVPEHLTSLTAPISDQHKNTRNKIIFYQIFFKY